MGDIKVRGNAKKTVIVDKMCLSITIRSKERTTTRALEEVRKQCEALLELMVANGIDISKITVTQEYVEETNRYSSDDVFMVGKKSLELNLCADVKAANSLIGLIQQSNYDIEARVNYYVGDATEIHKELLKEAVLDSKAKASAIAGALGEQIVRAKGIRDTNCNSGEYEEDYAEHLLIRYKRAATSETPLADSLGLPKEEYDEEVVVEWITEKSE